MGVVTAVPTGATGSHRHARARVLSAIATVAVASLAAGAVVIGAGLPDRPVALAANLTGSARPADVVDVKPVEVLAPLPPEPTRPIDVPSDPYAKEEVVEIGRIVIPKLGLDHVLMNGVTLNNIDRGPSHWPGSAYPGEAGNVVIAGHRVTHTHPFRNLDQLVSGDEVIVTARGVRATYSVLETFVVTPKQMEIVAPTTTGILTLFACHPPHSARQRIVVRAALVSAVPA
jgi:sortase A